MNFYFEIAARERSALESGNEMARSFEGFQHLKCQIELPGGSLRWELKNNLIIHTDVSECFGKTFAKHGAVLRSPKAAFKDTFNIFFNFSKNSTSFL